MTGEELVLNGRYELLERVGSGGMAVVYKAQDLMLGRIVAIKMLHEGFAGDPEFLQRFRQEAYSAASLQHPNIVTVHDIGQDGHRQYIVMEFVQGVTLKQIVRQYNTEGRTMPTSRMLALTIQICAGVGYAHRAGLVHCDVKPQNVIVTPDDRIKVADFGIARAMTEASQQVSEIDTWGTPQYFSPEQAAGEAPTPASDVYSIGVMMFEMLTGQLPFNADSQTALALKHIQDPPPLVSSINPGVPEQLELIVNKVLSKEPSGRYRTAGQLGRVLTTYTTSSQVETGPLVPIITVAAVNHGLPVSEQQTQVFPQSGSTISSPTKLVAETKFVGTDLANANDDFATDWLAVGLGLVAFVALLGLIPLWYFVYITYSN